LSGLKKLASQTAIYGISSIIGRLLNYLLVPLYTRVFSEGDYGIVTQLFAIVAFLNIVFTYGLETAFFKFSHSNANKIQVYSTALISLCFTSLIYCSGILYFSNAIAVSFTIDSQAPVLPYYIQCFAVVLAADAISALPFALLRQQQRALRFVSIRMVNISINVLLNLFFLVICPQYETSSDFIKAVYNSNIGVGYVFIVNMIASVVTVLLLLPELLKVKLNFDKKLWREMLAYSWPLMIAGFAGMINETLDRILLPIFLPSTSNALTELGIYGACYKLSMLMTLFVQTFRYAADPFYFSQDKKPEAKKVFALVMHYFVIICCLIFLLVMLYLPIFKKLIGERFYTGLEVVPILLIANLFLGIYYNLSVWYRLSGATKWGAYFSIVGAVITILFNAALVPWLGYVGAAWATLICYGSMMVYSFIMGQKHFNVPYQVWAFIKNLGLALGIYFLSILLFRLWPCSHTIQMGISTLLMLAFIAFTLLQERSKIVSFVNQIKKRNDSK
jgi:O-antigen/teichoic acid export membrane protein